jgi:hypothetical protein
LIRDEKKHGITEEQPVAKPVIMPGAYVPWPGFVMPFYNETQLKAVTKVAAFFM